MGATTGSIDELRELERRGDYVGLIAGLRALVAADRRTFVDPWVKEWCAKRWRNLFISAAIEDPKAVHAASQRLGVPGTDIWIRTRLDRRRARQRIAERFLKRMPEREWELDLPPPQVGEALDATLVFCPGLIGSMLPLRGFQRALPAVAARRGWRMLCAEAHPMRSCEANVDDLEAAIERGEGLDHDCIPISLEKAEPPGDVVLLGYSKGAPDALTLLIRRPELAARVKALYSWGGAIGGSHLADGVYELIKDLSVPPGTLGAAIRAVLRGLFPVIRLDAAAERVDEFDVKAAIHDLTTAERARFLDEHAEEIEALDLPIFSISGATSALEVPYFQVQGYLDIRRQSGDADNDMQVTQDQARWPGPMGVHLATLHAHHWDMAYDAFPRATRVGSANLDHPFPREAAITTIFQLTAELGLIE
jgi:pimeloyl-ACP methyl ester carboxylesterase